MPSAIHQAITEKEGNKLEAKDLIIRVGGEGGEGIISTGDFIAKAAARDGLHVLTFKTFPAEIKGGYAMYQTRMSPDELLSEGDGFQVLVVFNKVDERLGIDFHSLFRPLARHRPVIAQCLDLFPHLARKAVTLSFGSQIAQLGSRKKQ